MMAGFEDLFQAQWVLKPAFDAYSICKAELYGKAQSHRGRGTCSA